MPDEERFVAGHRPVHVEFLWVGKSIAVLTDDEVTFFETQQPLRLNADRRHTERLAACHQQSPQGIAMMGRHMHFPAEFADEADAHETRWHATDMAFATFRETESGTGEIDIVHQRRQQFARLRSCDIDCSPRAGDMQEVDVELPLRLPAQHLAIDAIDTGSGGSHVEEIFSEARSNAVVGDNAGLVGHQHIA